jgi:hypothetical protein
MPRRAPYDPLVRGAERVRPLLHEVPGPWNADLEQDLELTDRATGAQLKLRLPSQRARLAIIRKSDKKITWSPE